MSRDVQVSKYNITFEIELHAPSAADGFVRACGLLDETVQKLLRQRVEVAFSDGQLPCAGITGAPHGETLDGWRCIYSLRRL